MLVLWSLQENCKHSPLLPSFHSTFFYFTQMDSHHSKPISFQWPTHKGCESSHWVKNLQRGRVFMCLSPWSTFEHQTVNEPLVILRLLMNGIKNILSCTKIQRPAKATSIHSLMINLYASNHVSKLPTSLPWLWSSTLQCTDVILWPLSRKEVNMKDYAKLCNAVKIHKVWIHLRKWAR